MRRGFATGEAVGYTAPGRRIGLGPTVIPAAFTPARRRQCLPVGAHQRGAHRNRLQHRRVHHEAGRPRRDHRGRPAALSVASSTYTRGPFPKFRLRLPSRFSNGP